jgi:outer membrane protein W
MSEGDTSFESIEAAVKAEDNVGWNVGIEGRFNKWLGLELDYVRANQDVSFGGTVIGDANFSPLTATFNFHVVHTNLVDFYFGPSYSYVDWGDIKFNQEGQTLFSTDGLATDSSKGWGIGTGIDIGWKHFVFTAGLRYIDVSLEPQGSASTPVNPLVGRLGVGFRF